MILCNLVSGERFEAFLVDTVNEIFLGYQPPKIIDIPGTTSAPIIGIRCYYRSKLSYLYINLLPMTKTMCMPMEVYWVKSKSMHGLVLSQDWYIFVLLDYLIILVTRY
jgi:hypothetical protein